MLGATTGGADAMAGTWLALLNAPTLLPESPMLRSAMSIVTPPIAGPSADVRINIIHLPSPFLNYFSINYNIYYLKHVQEMEHLLSSSLTAFVFNAC